MNRRFGLYWAPAQGSALWDTGCRILGRDAATGDALPQPDLPGLYTRRFHDLTAAPRLYGLHATLKPPFRLAPDASPSALAGDLAAFAAARRPFRLPPMALTALGRFLALAPQAPCPELELLARDCVEAFDGFRAPPTAAELEKRRAGGLTARQEALLARWGYPYVMEEYRFHLTLTGSIHETLERQMCLQGLAGLLDNGLRQELARVEIREICLFEQTGQDQPFHIAGRFPFEGSGQAAP